MNFIGYLNLIHKKQYLYKVTIDKESSKNDVYPFDIPIISQFTKLDFHPNVTFIIGENGSGKSTLLEALAIKLGFNPEGGTKFINFSTNKSHSELYKYLKIHKHHEHPENHFFLRAESFYNVATEIDNVFATHNYGGKSLHHQSHGESFFSLMTHRFGKNGLYILDEPEAALSPNRQIAMLVIMKKLIKENCQFIITTHSPILLSYPNALIYEIDESGSMNKTKYEETDTYIIAKDFINNYQKIQNKLKL